MSNTILFSRQIYLRIFTKIVTFDCRRQSSNLIFPIRKFGSMTTANLDQIQNVDIDPEGRFKYILIQVNGKNLSDNSDISKLIVRGYSRAQWHNNIFDEVYPSIEALGFVAKCLGGGKIEHLPDAKKLKIYSKSTGFGKADHNESKKVLLTKYADYIIDVSDED